MNNYNLEKALELLFVSKVRVKVLKYLALNPDRAIHLRGAVREFDEEINAVRRELQRLEEINFVTTEAKGNRRFFTANTSHPFFKEMATLIHKTYGLGKFILEASPNIGDVKFAFLLSGYLKNSPSYDRSVDLVLVGDIDLQIVEGIIKQAQNELGKEIHYMVFKEQDFLLRKRRKDQLFMDLLMQDLVMLVGDYEKLVK